MSWKATGSRGHRRVLAWHRCTRVCVLQRTNWPQGGEWIVGRLGAGWRGELVSRLLSYEQERMLAWIGKGLVELERIDLRAIEEVEWPDLVIGWGWGAEERWWQGGRGENPDQLPGLGAWVDGEKPPMGDQLVVAVGAGVGLELAFEGPA